MLKGLFLVKYLILQGRVLILKEDAVVGEGYPVGGAVVSPITASLMRAQVPAAMPGHGRENETTVIDVFTAYFRWGLTCGIVNHSYLARCHFLTGKEDAPWYPVEKRE